MAEAEEKIGKLSQLWKGVSVWNSLHAVVLKKSKHCLRKRRWIEPVLRTKKSDSWKRAESVLRRPRIFWSGKSSHDGEVSMGKGCSWKDVAHPAAIYIVLEVERRGVISSERERRVIYILRMLRFYTIIASNVAALSTRQGKDRSPACHARKLLSSIVKMDTRLLSARKEYLYTPRKWRRCKLEMLYRRLPPKTYVFIPFIPFIYKITSSWFAWGVELPLSARIIGRRFPCRFWSPTSGQNYGRNASFGFLGSACWTRQRLRMSWLQRLSRSRATFMAKRHDLKTKRRESCFPSDEAAHEKADKTRCA